MSELADYFDFDVFEKSVDLLANRLAYFRDEGKTQPTDNDRLLAGHLAGGLAANKLLASRPSPEWQPILRDCIAFMKGDIAGSAQRDGIIREAEALLGVDR